MKVGPENIGRIAAAVSKVIGGPVQMRPPGLTGAELRMLERGQMEINLYWGEPMDSATRRIAALLHGRLREWWSPSNRRLAA